MKKSKKDRLLLALIFGTISIICFYFAIIERIELNNMTKIYEFLNGGDKIESIVVYDNSNDEEVIYKDKEDVQYLINKYKQGKLYGLTKEIMNHKVGLLYSIEVHLSEDWVEDMEIYHVDIESKKVYPNLKVTPIFKINGKDCVLLFRDTIVGIVVSD